MTILSPETLSMVLDLIESGASAVETTGAIGASPKSKIIFKWLADSELAGEFGARPDASSPYCVTRGDRLEWFHLLYSEAKEAGRAERAMRSPMRADLEQRLADKLARPVEPQRPPPRVQVFKPSDEPADPSRFSVTRAAAEPPAPPRPSYARKAPPLDAVNAEPPTEGRFLMTADRPKSKAEQRAGTCEITDLGIRRW